MKGKIKKTTTCEWIKGEPVEGTTCMAKTEEEFLMHENLLAIFEFKANVLLQRTGMALSEKLLDKEISPLTAWNDSQVFLMHDLAKTYAELVCMH